MGSANSLWKIWIPMLRCTRLKTYQRNVRLVKVRYTFIYNWIFVGLFGILNSTFASWFSATSSSSTLLLTSFSLSSIVSTFYEIKLISLSSSLQLGQVFFATSNLLVFPGESLLKKSDLPLFSCKCAKENYRYLP